MSPKSLTYLIGGELMLREVSKPSPEFYFEQVAPAFKKADLVFAHLELAHTKNYKGARGYAPRPVDNLRGIPYAGIHAVSMGFGGEDTIMDTSEWLDEHKIAHVGSAMNINEARKPLIIERDGTRFGYLFFQCVHAYAAGFNRPGAGYVDIISNYLAGAMPGSPSTPYTAAEHWSLEAMREDIRALRPKCDVLSVAIHMGRHYYQEVILHDYEFQVSYAAIDAGADIIIGNHAHQLSGVEFYKGKPIIHCVGNLVAAFPWSDEMPEPEPETILTKSKIRGRYGISPRNDWPDLETLKREYPTYPFPAFARKSMLVKCVVDKGKIARLSYIPLFINPQSQPEIVKHNALGQEIFDYMEKVTRAEGLNAKYEWDGDEVVIHE
jgi:hypothetical protein